MTVKRVAKKPKFRVGQVVSVEAHIGVRWLHGYEFARITKVFPPTKRMKATAPYCYRLEGWQADQVERNLRPLTKRERG